jgi:hypothetical protein
MSAYPTIVCRAASAWRPFQALLALRKLDRGITAVTTANAGLRPGRLLRRIAQICHGYGQLTALGTNATGGDKATRRLTATTE